MSLLATQRLYIHVLPNSSTGTCLRVEPAKHHSLVCNVPTVTTSRSRCGHIIQPTHHSKPAPTKLPKLLHTTQAVPRTIPLYDRTEALERSSSSHRSWLRAGARPQSQASACSLRPRQRRPSPCPRHCCSSCRASLW